MKTVIKWFFGAGWAASAALSVYLASSALRFERDPRLVWAWLIASGLIFLSATWLAGTVLFFRRDKDVPEPRDP